MSRVPETRASLILRLPTTDDASAWSEFAAIYEPFVYRFARRGGLQDADARELVQNVLLAVARAVGKWKPDAERGRFRSWLFRIARNQLIDLWAKRRRQEVATGGTSFVGVMEQLPAADCDESHLLLEHRRELFRLAAARVKHSVKPATWQAFWLTGVEECDPERAAREIGISVGAVYVARCRVIARLRDEYEELEDRDGM